MSGSYIRRAALGCAVAIATGAVAAVAQTTVKEIVVHPKSSQLAETRHKTVSYADLDLSSRAGQQAFLRRVKIAAKDVCAPQATGMSDRADYNKCYDGAVSGAVSDLGNDDVSAMYAKMK